MPILDEISPRLSPDVLVQPLDDEGRHIVKNRRKRTYLKLGAQESFLLLQLDGQRSYGAIAESFAQRFNEPLTCDDVQSFVTMAKGESLIERSNGSHRDDSAASDKQGIVALVKRTYQQARKQSPLYFRISLFDPDRVLNWLEPKTRWLFSRELAMAAAVGGLLAFFVTWANRAELVSRFSSHLGWETFVLAWLTAIAVTICHEFGHGLACKRNGGEVHEMGALWIFFTPCLFCNVSDAWLLPSRWQRLLISMAGTYVDFLIWIGAVFVWRVTSQETAINYMAWIIVSTCGLRVAFNLNPFMRLDGYFALCDLVGVHNLRRRGRERWLEFVRWLLWGAAWPRPITSGRVLLAYGAVYWCFKVVLLSLVFFHVAVWLQSVVGIAGFVAVIAFAAKFMKRYFKGSLGEDFKNMFHIRKKRVLLWGAVVLGILVVPMYDRAGGPFQVRPMVRWEVRAPIAGFLRIIESDEGDQVSAGSVLARIEVPELESQISRKEAELNETAANLRRLQAGARPEEIAEQEKRVERAVAWRDLAQHDLGRAQQGLFEELAQFDLRIAQAHTELDYRTTIFQQAKQLYEKGGLAGQQLLAEKKKTQEAESALHQAEAQKRAREAEGVLSHEGELARREKELADTRAALSLLAAGSRPEDIEAETAHLRRLQEEMSHLRQQQQKQVISCPVAGIITTPRLKEKVGQYLEQGAVICVVEDLSNFEAEIAVAEQDARVLVAGQRVTLKPRALPFCTLTGKVDRIAPAAAGQQDSKQSTVTVYCQVENEQGLLRTGMTGFGRINYRLRPIGWIALTTGMRFVRTEFWW